MASEEKRLIDSGIAAYRKGDVTEAENIFRSFMREYPESDLADNACYNLAKIAVGKGDDQRALNWYEHLLETYPDSDAAYFGKDEYIELSRSMGKEIPEIADECYFNAKQLFSKGKITEAEAGFKRVIEEYTTSEYVDNAHYYLAKICKKRGDKEGMKRHIDIIMNEYGDTDAALYAKSLLI